MLNSRQEKTMNHPESEPRTESTVLYAAQGAVAVVTLNRPQALNSFSRQMHHDLWAALDRAEADPLIRALVITGAGRGFCAGADLSEFDFTPGPNLVERADPGPLIEQAFNPTARRLLALRMPTDMAVAAPTASFLQAFSKIGLVPDAGGSWLLVQKLGLARAMGLALTGDKLTGVQAKEWGMVWDVADDPLAAAITLAQRLALMPTKALVATRHLLREGITRTLDRQLDEERDQQSALSRTHDYMEGVTAFLEKRPAAFKGE
jgi:2-(1,2-epoxy-1,2-dihydrophenyl)acetyl-CoA isomerase